MGWASRFLITDCSQHVDPAINSISYLSLLIATRIANGLPQPELLAKVSIFLVSFDARQIRYAGKAFSLVLDWLTSGDMFPVSDCCTATALPVANQD